MIKLLSILLGFDKDILKTDKFSSLSVITILFVYISVLLLSLYACYFAGYLMTDSVFSSIILSIFLTYILHNMYRLIIASSYQGSIMTTKRDLFKYISQKGFLVIILSLFIASTLCVSMFDKEIVSEMKSFKTQLIFNYDKALDNTYKEQISDLVKTYEDEKEFNLLMNQQNSIKDSLALIKKISSIEQIKQSKREVFHSTIQESNFFIRKILIISDYPKSWILTIMIVMFFLLPLYLFNRLDYFLLYQLSVTNIQNKLILSEYNSYKNKYVTLLTSSSGQEATINERYEDPPFNTRIKTRNIKFLEKGSLLKWIKKFYG